MYFVTPGHTVSKLLEVTRTERVTLWGPAQPVRQFLKRGANKMLWWIRSLLPPLPRNRRTSMVRTYRTPRGGAGVILTPDMVSAEDTATGDRRAASTKLDESHD